MRAFLSLRTALTGNVVLLPADAIAAVFSVPDSLIMAPDVRPPNHAGSSILHDGFVTWVRETPIDIANQFRAVNVPVARSPLGPPPEQQE